MASIQTHTFPIHIIQTRAILLRMPSSTMTRVPQSVSFMCVVPHLHQVVLMHVVVSIHMQLRILRLERGWNEAGSEAGMRQE